MLEWPKEEAQNQHEGKVQAGGERASSVEKRERASRGAPRTGLARRRPQLRGGDLPIRTTALLAGDVACWSGKVTGRSFPPGGPWRLLQVSKESEVRLLELSRIRLSPVLLKHYQRPKGCAPPRSPAWNLGHRRGGHRLHRPDRGSQGQKGPLRAWGDGAGRSLAAGVPHIPLGSPVRGGAGTGTAWLRVATASRSDAATWRVGSGTTPANRNREWCWAVTPPSPPPPSPRTSAMCPGSLLQDPLGFEKCLGQVVGRPSEAPAFPESPPPGAWAPYGDICKEKQGHGNRRA